MQKSDSGGELFIITKNAGKPDDGHWKRGIAWLRRRLHNIEEELEALPRSTSDDRHSLRNPNREVHSV